MEHAGATFFNEDVVLFRTVPTVNDTNLRAETVLHELAHQWFGDLVTMRWFDDLWLKDGFAQYMAYHTMADLNQAELNSPEPVWKRFYQSIKHTTHEIDATHGTTPIYQQIPNLKDAKSAYGAIVYQKAPGLLRVLAFDIGEEHFREGVRTFLREHAYANAEWGDLIGSFSRASGMDLKPWAKAWVEQRGMPKVEMDWACDSGTAHLVVSDPPERRAGRRPSLAGADSGAAGLRGRTVRARSRRARWRAGFGPRGHRKKLSRVRVRQR